MSSAPPCDQRLAWIRRSTPWLYSAIVHLLAIVVLLDLALPGPPVVEPHTVALAMVVASSDDLGDLGNEPVAPPSPQEEAEAEVPAETPREEPSTPAAAPPPEAPRVDPERRDLAPPTAEELELLLGRGGSPQPLQPLPDAASAADATSLVRALVSQREATRGDHADPYGLRSHAGRAAGIAAHGGSARTESAVEDGLDWLARHQEPDGSWRLAAYADRCPSSDRCSGAGYRTYDIGGTGLALLAFLGAGYHHLGPADAPSARHQTTIARAITFLRATQGSDGRFGDRGANQYNHAIALLALIESFALSGDARLRRPIGRGVDYLIAAQEPRGGWNYSPHPEIERNDTSITGWVLMALHGASLNGFVVPATTLRRCRSFLGSMTTADGQVGYADSGQLAFRRSRALVPVGLLSHLLLGGSLDQGTSRAQLAILAAHPPRWQDVGTLDGSLYYVYYGTLATFFAGGDAFAAWNRALVDTLLPMQETRGHARGSWPSETKWGAQHGGRIYTTALSVLCLEIYYKYRPSYLKRLERS